MSHTTSSARRAAAQRLLLETTLFQEETSLPRLQALLTTLEDQPPPAFSAEASWRQLQATHPDCFPLRRARAWRRWALAGSAAALAALVLFILLSLAVFWFVGRPMVRFAKEPELFRQWIAGLGLDCYEYQCGKGVHVGEETARSCKAAAGKAAPRGNAAGNHTVMKREGAEIGKSGSHPFGEHQQIVRR